MLSRQQEQSDSSPEIEKVAKTASQMGHSVDQIFSEDGVNIETLNGDMITVIDYGSDSNPRYGRYEIRVNNTGTDYDDFDVLLSQLIDELLIS